MNTILYKFMVQELQSGCSIVEYTHQYLVHLFERNVWYILCDQVNIVVDHGGRG